MKKATLILTVLIAVTMRTNAQWISQSSGVSTNLHAVVFTDANTGVAVGNGGKILRTTNGGSNWIQQTSGTTNDLFEVYFVDAYLGYAVGYLGTILKSIDGGISWTVQNSGTTNQLNSVYFTDASTGYAAGGNFGIQTILKTVDGGANWVSQTTVTSQQLSSIYFTSADTGFASGNAGTILKTTNGGTNWTAQTSGISQLLRSLFFTDSNTGYTVGELGAILKTVNGGANWTTQSSGTIGSIFSIFFTDDNTGYAVGIFGEILKTVDGGTNWIEETSGTDNWLFYVYFPNAFTGYAVGEDGIILKTELPAPPPVSIFTVADATICIGETIWVINQSTNATGYTWEFPGGSPEVSNAFEPIVTYSSAGIKTITLTATSGEFSDTYSWTIEVLPDPGATIGDVNPVCTGDSIVFNGSIENASSFAWSPTTGLSDSLSLTPFCTPTEEVEYTLTAENGNCSATAVVLIEVIPYPLVMIGDVNPVCLGDSIVLNGTIENASSFEWSPTTGLSDPLSSTPSCAPTENVEYTLTADNGSCSATALVVIDVNPLPQPVVFQTGNQLSVEPFASIQWLLNGDVIPGANDEVYIPTTNGNYTVSVADENGCVAFSTAYSFIVDDISEFEKFVYAVFPNPLEEEGVIVADEKIKHYDILNSLGQIVDSGKITMRRELNTSIWQAGLYTLRLYGDDGFCGVVQIIRR
jgi:photosystem II stability/assembly factor-like uncharacterized protein